MVTVKVFLIDLLSVYQSHHHHLYKIKLHQNLLKCYQFLVVHFIQLHVFRNISFVKTGRKFRFCGPVRSGFLFYQWSFISVKMLISPQIRFINRYRSTVSAILQNNKIAPGVWTHISGGYQGYEPTSVVFILWSEVNDLNHSAIQSYKNKH
jgi:hypothetical protein